MSLYDVVLDLSRESPDLFEFVRQIPHGLVIEEKEGADVSLTVHPTFCVISGSPETQASALLPPLERLKVSVETNFALIPEVSMFGELLWLYSYARAKYRAPELTHLNATSGDARRGWQIASLKCHTLDKFSPLEQLQSVLLSAYEFPESHRLRDRVDPNWLEVWQAATKIESSRDFIDLAARTLNLELAPEFGHFHSLEKPRKRIVLHRVAGASGGVLATCPFAEFQTEEELRTLMGFLIHNPLIFENHDRAKPIGLSFNHHIDHEGDGKANLHGDIYVTSDDFWRRRDGFRGFSVGLFRNE